jgi:hypothetical protein
MKVIQASTIRIIVVLALGFSSSCSLPPIENATSLSPAVKADTLGYNNAIGEVADQILLTNVLRSRDLEPLNLSQLSSISGSLSLQGSAGFSIPWGIGLGGVTLSSAGQRLATPSISGSTSPTYTLTPLNTQAFTLSILQPVSASYVLNRWQAGVPRELLLYLFAKEVDLPALDKETGAMGTKRYINDPDNPGHFAAFQNLISDWIKNGHAELKAVDVLDPVGPAFSLYASTSESTSSQAKDGGTPHPTPTPTPTPATTTKNNIKTNADSNGFGLITSSNDGQYHVGNEEVGMDIPDDGSRSPAEGAADGGKAPKPVQMHGGQLYRVYAGQVELCVESAHLAADSAAYPSEKEALSPLKMVHGPGGGSTQPQAAQATPGGPSHSGSPPTSSATPAAMLTAALQAGRVSAVVDAASARGDQVVLTWKTEEDFESASARFVHIQWRSVAEIFDYLGAILRYNERHPDHPFQFTPVPDGSVRSDSPAEADPIKPSSSILFAVHRNLVNAPAEHLFLFYNGRPYYVDDVDASAPTADFTKPILSMLSTLVDYSSQSAGGSSSTPIRLQPIP